jgi:hypothetical protein
MPPCLVAVSAARGVSIALPSEPGIENIETAGSRIRRNKGV